VTRQKRQQKAGPPMTLRESHEFLGPRRPENSAPAANTRGLWMKPLPVEPVGSGRNTGCGTAGVSIMAIQRGRR